MNKLKNTLWGIILIGIGIILGLNALEITDINIFFSGWWTLFIIIPSFIDLLADENKTGSLIGLIIGVLLFMSCQDIVGFDFIWKLFFPLVLVIVGISIIFKDNIGNNVSKKIKELNKKSSEKNEYFATFSEQKLDYTNEKFTGCDVSAVFGGADINLRNAIIKEDVVINASAIFGGVTIHTPKDINVKVNSTSIFGGVENKNKSNSDTKITVYINATCLFGGVEIK